MLFFVVLLVNGILAWLTARDAYSRGKHVCGWFVAVLIFSIFAAVCYLLIRPDERLPPAERERSRSDLYLTSFVLYVGTTIGGFAAGIILASYFTGLGMPPTAGAGVQMNDILIAGLTVSPPTAIFALGGRKWFETVVPTGGAEGSW